MAENSRIEKLQEELDNVKRELAQYQQPDALENDLYYSAKYWRDRCLKAETQLDVLKIINEDIGNRQRAK